MTSKARTRFTLATAAVLIATAAVAWTLSEEPTPSTATYQSERYGIAFTHPDSWVITESGGWRQPAVRDVWQAQILATPSDSAMGFVVNIWAPKPEDLSTWIYETLPVRPEDVDLESVEYTVGGYPAYAFDISEGEGESTDTMIVFQNDQYVYQIAIPGSYADPALSIARSILVDDGGSAFDLDPVLPNWPRAVYAPSKLRSIVAAVSSCAGCPNETDAYSNSYQCCDSKGNCTWKAEQMRAGANNFYFTGSGRDAYKWMDLEYSTSGQSYAQGGSIPAAGAAVVMIKGYCTSCQLGHVATVKSVNSDGSIVVTEQNCNSTCGQLKTLTTSKLRTYLAGYIYNSSSPPSPTARAISTTVGGVTIVDDYNFSSVYNFLAKGPGTRESFNGGYRAWYTSSSGYNSWMHATRTTSSFANMGLWQTRIGASGVYEIHAYIPSNDHATATAARYRVNGTWSSPINQGTTKGWVKVRNPNRADGNWSLTTGTRAVELFDSQSGTAGRWLAFDALRFIRRG